MARGRGPAVAILGAGALAVAAAALVAGRSDPYRREDVAPIAEAARSGVAAASAAAQQELVAEATAAAAIPQLRAALHNRADAPTFQDLFQTESWWEPYRARALTLVGPNGPFVTRNAPGAGPGGDELVARAAPGRPASAVVRLGDPSQPQPFLAAAAAIDVEDLPRWTLVLGRPIDRTLLAEWSERAHASLLLSDGHRVLSGESSLRPEALVGHEAEPLVVDAAAGWVAAPLAPAQGLWIWCVRPLPAELAKSRPTALLYAVAGALAVAAIALLVSRRRARPEGPGAPVAVELASGRSSGTSMPRVSSASHPTMIAGAGGDPLVFGRYRVIDRLGEGGMCELYTAGLAGPEGFQRTFVLKRLKAEIARNRAAVDQFIDEAKLGSTLVHSNIVPVFDFGHAGDGYFIAQEYVVGRNVGQVIERHMQRLGEPLDLPTVIYIAYEALQALAYAHDKTNDEGELMNLVHRDVSPGNILVSAAGEVKLIDFGIAKADGRVSHTDMGNVKGNAAFMAPEQARGLAIDGRADLFSLGLVAYYALTGEPLYKGGTSAEVFYAAASGPSRERLDRLNRLPPLAMQVLGKALAADPNDRYATAEEFAADLADHIGPGARTAMATLLHALFGPELRPSTGGGGSSVGTGTSGMRRKTG
jgi:hypothetical protein